MTLAVEYAGGSGVVNPIIDLERLVVQTEEKGKASFVYVPDGADRLYIEKVQPIIDSSGIFRQQVYKYDLRYEREIEILDQMFLISSEAGLTSVFHKQWPISGQGNNLREAISDLRSTIRDVKDHYAHIPIDNLDGRAILFRDFILSLNA